MDQDHKDLSQKETENASGQSSDTPTRTRVFAWLGVIFMVLLVLGYTYAVATGKIFAF